MSFLDNDNDAEYELISEGNYQAIIDDVGIETDYTNRNGETYPKVTVTWKFSNNRLVWQNLIFKDTTKSIIANFAKGLGITNEVKAQVKDADDAAQVANAIYNSAAKRMNKSFEIHIKHNQYNDKTYYNVYVNKPLDKVPKNYAPQTKTASQSVPTFDASEEIPF